MIKMTIQNNKYVPMTKEQFVKTISEIKEYHRKLNNIQTVLEENCEDTIFWPPSLENTLVEVLKDSFNDETDIIGYFIYELEFGDQWNPGCIEENGKDVKMQTPEELYDYLVDGLKE